MPPHTLLKSSGVSRRQIVQAGASVLPLAWVGQAGAQQKFTFRLAHSEAIGAPLTLALTLLQCRRECRNGFGKFLAEVLNDLAA